MSQPGAEPPRAARASNAVLSAAERVFTSEVLCVFSLSSCFKKKIEFLAPKPEIFGVVKLWPNHEVRLVLCIFGPFWTK